MPVPAPFDVHEYLVPIAGDNPSGESLRWEDEYAQIERAREEDDDDPGGPWKKRDAKKADWDAVIALGLKVLKEKSKDLQIAAWVAEAMVRRRGLTGLRDGLLLIRALQDAFWETAHPEAGEIELREGIYDFLDDEKRLPLLIRGQPLTDVPGLGPYSLLKFNESREVDNLLRRPPKEGEDLEATLKEEGKIRGSDFDKASDATDRTFYVMTVERLGECLEAVRQLNLSIKAPEHCGDRGHTLTRTAAALEEVAKLAGQLLAKKPGPEPSEEVAEPEPDRAAWDEDEAPGEATPSWESASPAEPSRSEPPRTRPGPRSSGGPISGPEDARSRIVAAARHLREADPSDPRPYLVVRALGMGELYRSAGPIDPSILRAPSSEDRQSLRRLANEGSWPELLERAEIVLSSPQGAGWLDARRLAFKALSELGHENAARAAGAILGAELRDYPDWPRSELDDGTPSAGSETRAWIEETFPAASRDDRPAYPRDVPVSFEANGAIPRGETNEGESDSEGNPPLDPWDQAQELLRQGRSQEAIALVGRAAREARTGRERFLRTFQQAEFCLMMGRPGVALPLLEGLARQIDELKLDRWEDPLLCARVVASLYRCLRGKNDERARTVYERLCQLDIGQALSVADGADA